MPTYPTYKLSEVADILDSFRKPINSTERTKRIQGKTENELYPYYGATGQVGLIDEYLTDGEYVLVGEDGAPFLEPFKNKSYIIRGKAWVNNHAHILSGKKDVLSNQYLNYFLNSFDYRNYVNGTTRLKLTQGNLTQIPIPLPPLPTQHAIVSRIETLFAELDKAVQHLCTAQQQIKTYRQAVLNHWLNNDDGKWEMVNISCFLDNSCKGMMTGPFGTALKKSEHKSCGIPVLGIENIGEGSFVMPNKIFVTEEKAKELKTFAVKTDDIIISRSGTVGEICKVPFFMNDALLSTNLIRIRLNLDLINADYFVLLFQSSQIKQQVKDLCKGTTRAFLNQTILSQISFPYPPLSEQQRIVAEIESRLSQAEAVEASIGKALQQAEALRQSILKKAFNGELE